MYKKPVPHRPRSFAVNLCKICAMVTLLGLVQACTDSSQPELPSPSTSGQTETTPSKAIWNCVNDLEVTCLAQGCDAATVGDFTPMSVTLTSEGSMDVCAYTGCWQGIGTLYSNDDFRIWAGQDLSFSTAPDPAVDQQDIVIALDLVDGVATLKAGAFAHPLHCTSQEVE